jgi:hypothetical protein
MRGLHVTKISLKEFSYIKSLIQRGLLPPPSTLPIHEIDQISDFSKQA